MAHALQLEQLGAALAAKDEQLQEALAPPSPSGKSKNYPSLRPPPESRVGDFE